MSTEIRTHIFCQIGPGEPRLFAFGSNGARYTENEVEALIRMLPPQDKVIKIVWVKAEYPLWHPGHPDYKKPEDKTTLNLNNDERLN